MPLRHTTFFTDSIQLVVENGVNGGLCNNTKSLRLVDVEHVANILKFSSGEGRTVTHQFALKDPFGGSSASLTGQLVYFNVPAAITRSRLSKLADRRVIELRQHVNQIICKLLKTFVINLRPGRLERSADSNGCELTVGDKAESAVQ